MNLRDKLKAIEKPKSPPKAPEKQFTDCYHGREMRELSEFPGAFDLDLSALRLMTQETLSDDLDPRNILYLDTETTGFMGAGTVAFEVGMGCLTDSGFQIHQLVMRDYPEEKFLLQSIADTLMGYDAICTFNGRTFDVPLLRDRFLMNRMTSRTLTYCTLRGGCSNCACSGAIWASWKKRCWAFRALMICRVRRCRSASSTTSRREILTC